ncbi:uncharacterized protein [Maniola hyperantus]|uniref:uncharacterized protein n=1 Tax=Aphantopus hyperantus TaxID=2795564 RepID=UPI00374A5084
MRLIALLSIIAFSYGEKLDKTYLPPNAQASGGSSEILQAPISRPIVVVNDEDFQRQIDETVEHEEERRREEIHRTILNNGVEFQRPSIANVVTDSPALQRPIGFVVNTNNQEVNDVVRIGNRGNNFVQKQNPVEYKDVRYPGPNYQVVEQRHERKQAVNERNAAIVRQEYKNEGDAYAYAYETENGIWAEENGVATNGVNAKGAFFYIGDDGVQYSMSYTADENGFVPQGDHIPGIPEEILRALEQNARDEAAGIFDDGSYDERKYGEENSNQQRVSVVTSRPNVFIQSYPTPPTIIQSYPTVPTFIQNRPTVATIIDQGSSNEDAVSKYRLPGYRYPTNLVNQQNTLAPVVNGLIQEVTPRDDGNFYQVEYAADENGFVPKGAHLPTAPPIPDEILRVIEQAARDKEAGVYDDGSYNEEKYGYKKYQEGYPKTNTNIINEAKFSPENQRNTEMGDIFKGYEDLNEENRLENPEENTKNDVNGGILSIKNTENNYHSDNDDGDNISPSNNIVLNENYQEPLSESDVDVSKSDKTDLINSKIATGYEYFPPQFSFYYTNKMKPFPFRFSGVGNQDLQPETKENNTKKVTAKPFLTPYVIRKGDDSEINNYDEQFQNEQQETDFDEETVRNRSKGNFEDDPNDFDDQQFGNKGEYQESFADNQYDKPINMDEEVDSRQFIPGNKQLQYGDRIPNVNHLVPSDDKGYFDQNISKPFITLNPRVSYTTSTAASTEFPAGSTEDVNSTPVKSPSSFQTPSFSTTSFIDASSTKIPISSLLTNTVNPDAYSKTDSLSTPGVTRFSMSYRPTTESSKDFDRYNSQTSPEDVIGEDFSGPKQAQQFDPITGYYY